MPALKNIGNIGKLVGLSPLHQSPMWEQDIAQISHIQIQAFVKRFAIEGRRDIAESAVAIAMEEIKKAIENGLPAPKMMQYRPPERRYMTFGELKAGLSHMTNERAAAVLFALEMKLEITDVVSLRWQDLQQMQVDNRLTPIALECLRGTVRSISNAYVFWSNIEERQSPLFGLDADIFDAFGLVWGELEAGYRNLIMCDEFKSSNWASNFSKT